MEDPPATPSFPFLPGEPTDRAVSIGDTTHGMVVNGASLRESESLKILPKQRARDLRYGTSELVELLDHAGKQLYRETKTALWVGNLGRKYGGDIEWSVSHNAGRDADIAFAYVDAVSKKPVDPPDLVPLGHDGLSADRKLGFDAARTWKVVKALLQFEGTSIQYLFISDSLKKKLLEHAKASGEPAKFIEYAAELLRQPMGAAPHDDHLHLRIYCGKLDAACGCKDIGFIHERARRHVDEEQKARATALSQLKSPVAEDRKRALLRLVFVGDAAALAQALPSLSDREAEVRRAAVLLMGQSGDRQYAEALVRQFRAEDDPNVLAQIIEAAGLLGGPTSGELLRDVLEAFHGGPTGEAVTVRPFLKLPAANTIPDYSARLLNPPLIETSFINRRGLADLAVRAARTVESEHVLRPLLVELEGTDEGAIQRAAEALAYITNLRLLGDAKDADALRRARTGYAAFAQTLGKPGKPLRWAPRDSWVLQGFATRGYQVPGVDARGSWELFRALADEPHIAYNARSVLIRVLGADPTIARFGAGDACRALWEIAWDRRRELRLGSPNPEQARACARTRTKEKEQLAAD